MWTIFQNTLAQYVVFWNHLNPNCNWVSLQTLLRVYKGTANFRKSLKCKNENDLIYREKGYSLFYIRRYFQLATSPLQIEWPQSRLLLSLFSLRPLFLFLSRVPESRSRFDFPFRDFVDLIKTRRTLKKSRKRPSRTVPNASMSAGSVECWTL